jgi:hypothetical protein
MAWEARTICGLPDTYINIGFIKPKSLNYIKNYLSMLTLVNNCDYYYFLGYGIQYNRPLYKNINGNIGVKYWFLSLNKNTNIFPLNYSINIGIELNIYPFGPWYSFLYENYKIF